MGQEELLHVLVSETAMSAAFIPPVQVLRSSFKPWVRTSWLVAGYPRQARCSGGGRLLLSLLDGLDARVQTFLVHFRV